MDASSSSSSKPKKKKRENRERDLERGDNNDDDNNNNSKKKSSVKTKKKKKKFNVTVEEEQRDLNSDDLEYRPPPPRFAQNLIISAVALIVFSVGLLFGFILYAPVSDSWSTIVVAAWALITAFAAIVSAIQRTEKPARFYRVVLWCFLPLSLSCGSLNLLLLALSPCLSPCKLVADCTNSPSAHLTCSHQLFLSFALAGATLVIPSVLLCTGMHATAADNITYIKATTPSPLTQAHVHADADVDVEEKGASSSSSSSSHSNNNKSNDNDANADDNSQLLS